MNAAEIATKEAISKETSLGKRQEQIKEHENEVHHRLAKVSNKERDLLNREQQLTHDVSIFRQEKETAQRKMNESMSKQLEAETQLRKVRELSLKCDRDMLTATQRLEDAVAREEVNRNTLENIDQRARKWEDEEFEAKRRLEDISTKEKQLSIAFMLAQNELNDILSRIHDAEHLLNEISMYVNESSSRVSSLVIGERDALDLIKQAIYFHTNSLAQCEREIIYYRNESEQIHLNSLAMIKLIESFKFDLRLLQQNDTTNLFATFSRNLEFQTSRLDSIELELNTSIDTLVLNIDSQDSAVKVISNYIKEKGMPLEFLMNDAEYTIKDLLTTIEAQQVLLESIQSKVSQLSSDSTLSLSPQDLFVKQSKFMEDRVSHAMASCEHADATLKHLSIEKSQLEKLSAIVENENVQANKKLLYNEEFRVILGQKQSILDGEISKFEIEKQIFEARVSEQLRIMETSYLSRISESEQVLEEKRLDLEKRQLEIDSSALENQRLFEEVMSKNIAEIEKSMKERISAAEDILKKKQNDIEIEAKERLHLADDQFQKMKSTVILKLEEEYKNKALEYEENIQRLRLLLLKREEELLIVEASMKSMTRQIQEQSVKLQSDFEEWKMQQILLCDEELKTEKIKFDKFRIELEIEFKRKETQNELQIKEALSQFNIKESELETKYLSMAESINMSCEQKINVANLRVLECESQMTAEISRVKKLEFDLEANNQSILNNSNVAVENTIKSLEETHKSQLAAIEERMNLEISRRKTKENELLEKLQYEQERYKRNEIEKNEAYKSKLEEMTLKMNEMERSCSQTVHTIEQRYRDHIILKDKELLEQASTYEANLTKETMKFNQLEIELHKVNDSEIISIKNECQARIDDIQRMADLRILESRSLRRLSEDVEKVLEQREFELNKRLKLVEEREVEVKRQLSKCNKEIERCQQSVTLIQSFVSNSNKGMFSLYKSLDQLKSSINLATFRIDDVMLSSMSSRYGGPKEIVFDVKNANIVYFVKDSEQALIETIDYVSSVIVEVGVLFDKVSSMTDDFHKKRGKLEENISEQHTKLTDINSFCEYVDRLLSTLSKGLISPVSSILALPQPPSFSTHSYVNLSKHAETIYNVVLNQWNVSKDQDKQLSELHKQRQEIQQWRQSCENDIENICQKTETQAQLFYDYISSTLSVFSVGLDSVRQGVSEPEPVKLPEDLRSQSLVMIASSFTKLLWKSLKLISDDRSSYLNDTNFKVLHTEQNYMVENENIQLFLSFVNSLCHEFIQCLHNISTSNFSGSGVDFNSFSHFKADSLTFRISSSLKSNAATLQFALASILQSIHSNQLSSSDILERSSERRRVLDASVREADKALEQREQAVFLREEQLAQRSEALEKLRFRLEDQSTSLESQYLSLERTLKEISVKEERLEDLDGKYEALQKMRLSLDHVAETYESRAAALVQEHSNLNSEKAFVVEKIRDMEFLTNSAETMLKSLNNKLYSFQQDFYRLHQAHRRLVHEHVRDSESLNVLVTVELPELQNTIHSYDAVASYELLLNSIQGIKEEFREFHDKYYSLNQQRLDASSGTMDESNLREAERLLLISEAQLLKPQVARSVRCDDSANSGEIKHQEVVSSFDEERRILLNSLASSHDKIQKLEESLEAILFERDTNMKRFENDFKLQEDNLKQALTRVDNRQHELDSLYKKLLRFEKKVVQREAIVKQSENVFKDKLTQLETKELQYETRLHLLEEKENAVRDIRKTALQDVESLAQSSAALEARMKESMINEQIVTDIGISRDRLRRDTANVEALSQSLTIREQQIKEDEDSLQKRLRNLTVCEIDLEEKKESLEKFREQLEERSKELVAVKELLKSEELRLNRYRIELESSYNSNNDTTSEFHDRLNEIAAAVAQRDVQLKTAESSIAGKVKELENEDRRLKLEQQRLVAFENSLQISPLSIALRQGNEILKEINEEIQCKWHRLQQIEHLLARETQRVLEFDSLIITIEKDILKLQSGIRDFNNVIARSEVLIDADESDEDSDFERFRESISESNLNADDSYNLRVNGNNSTNKSAISSSESLKLERRRDLLISQIQKLSLSTSLSDKRGFQSDDILATMRQELAIINKTLNI